MSLSTDKNPKLEVLSVLRQLADIPALEWTYFERRLEWLELEPRQALTEAGVIADRLGFVVRGLIRKLHLTARGKRVVRGFGGPGSVVGAYASLLTREPSHLRVEALEPTGLFAWPWAETESLYARHVCWQIVGRRIAETNLIEREQRAHELRGLGTGAEPPLTRHVDCIDYPHDPQTHYWGIPPLFTQEGSQDRQTPQPRDVLDAGGRRETRTRRAILQAALTALTRRACSAAQRAAPLQSGTVGRRSS